MFLSFDRFAWLMRFLPALVLCGSASAEILRVPSQYPSLRHALNAAHDGDEILVADGVYRGGNNKNLDFHGKRVALRSENGAQYCVIDCEGAGRAFKFHGGETPETLLEGFTIRNGSMLSGGGILCIGSSPSVRNCIFADNTAHPGHYNGGGGMSNQFGSHPVVSGCLFLRNRQLQHSGQTNGGGGMNNAYGSNPSVSHCVFAENFAEQGGGMLNAVDCNPVVTDCLFVGNRAQVYGGGMIVAQECSLYLRGCRFEANFSGEESAGLGLYNGTRAMLIDCEFEDNHAIHLAGGMGSFGSETIVFNSSFIGNVASSTSWVGGGGGVVSAAGIGKFYNCLFSGNNGGNGEAGALGGGGQGTFNTLVNCTLVGNRANGGGALCVVNGANVKVVNCILWDNHAANVGPEIAMIQFGMPFAPTTTLVEHCVVEGGTASVWLENPGFQLQWGKANIALDPGFADPLQGAFGLDAGSPCIDAGLNSALPEDVIDLDGDGITNEPLPFDLLGNPRMSGRPPQVDMGAFEFLP